MKRMNMNGLDHPIDNLAVANDINTNSSANNSTTISENNTADVSNNTAQNKEIAMNNTNNQENLNQENMNQETVNQEAVSEATNNTAETAQEQAQGLGSKIKSFILGHKKASTGAAAAALVLLIGLLVYNNTRAPYFPDNEPDTDMQVEFEEPVTALGDVPGSNVKSTSTTKKTSKTTKKNVTLKTASNKTYTKSLGTKTSKNSKTVKKNETTTVKTDSTVAVTTTEKYTKNKKIKTVTTKTVTTTKTTTTVVLPTNTPAPAANTQVASNAGSKQSGNTEVSIRTIAPLLDSRVANAFETLGFKVVIDPSVSYSGYFDAKAQSITLRAANDTIYHEVGHFLAFIAGNVDRSTNFQSVYGAEKASFPGMNKVYATQSASEFYAESYREYVLHKGDLVAKCPKTSSTLEASLNTVTDTQIKKLKIAYSAYWK